MVFTATFDVATRSPLLRPLVTVLVCAGLAFPQTGSLPSRETLLYNIEWRLFSAGKAKLDFAALPASRPEYQVDLHLESSGFVSKLFKVEDDYSASLNAGPTRHPSCLSGVELAGRPGLRISPTRPARVLHPAGSHPAPARARHRFRLRLTCLIPRA